jgi:hypothetical protein
MLTLRKAQLAIDNIGNANIRNRLIAGESQEPIF